MGARNGVTAAIQVQLGFTGFLMCSYGEHNALQALSAEPKPEKWSRDWAVVFYHRNCDQPFSVGYPIQAPLDAFLTLVRAHVEREQCGHIVVTFRGRGPRRQHRSMPDSCCQHIIALALVDGAVSFEDSHSYERMADPKVRAVRDRVELIADPALMDRAAPRSGRVEVKLRDGRTVSHFTRHAPGTKENPLDTESVNKKARLLMAPVLGNERTEQVIQRVNASKGWMMCARCGHSSQVRKTRAVVLEQMTDTDTCWSTRQS